LLGISVFIYLKFDYKKHAACSSNHFQKTTNF